MCVGWSVGWFGDGVWWMLWFFWVGGVNGYFVCRGIVGKWCVCDFDGSL